jgi:hypothetical protein
LKKISEFLHYITVIDLAIDDSILFHIKYDCELQKDEKRVAIKHDIDMLSGSFDLIISDLLINNKRNIPEDKIIRIFTSGDIDLVFKCKFKDIYVERKRETKIIDFSVTTGTENTSSLNFDIDSLYIHLNNYTIEKSLNFYKILKLNSYFERKNIKTEWLKKQNVLKNV